MTLHPQGKSGVNIDRDKYDTMRQAILDVVQDNGEITFQELTEDVRCNLAGKFDGSINWYVTTVKLDLEARGTVERIPKSSPQRLRMAATPRANPKAI
jgi:hypothetical protein